MKARCLAWWKLRSRREQRLLLAMAALAALVLAWLLVVRPIDDRLAEARRDAAEAAIAAARVEDDAAAIRRIERTAPARTSLPLLARIARLAEADAIPIAPPRAEGNGATLAIAAVRPAALLAWAARLEREGLVIERLAARTNPDRTLAAELTVRARR